MSLSIKPYTRNIEIWVSNVVVLKVGSVKHGGGSLVLVITMIPFI